MGLALTAACSGSEDESPSSVSSAVDAYITELNRQVEIYCDCYAEWGYDSASDCQTDEGYSGPSQRRCAVDAFGKDPSGRIYLDCVVPLEREFTTCLNQRLECGDLMSDEVCYIDYDVGYDSCITLPQAIERDLEMCD